MEATQFIIAMDVIKLLKVIKQYSNTSYYILILNHIDAANVANYSFFKTTFKLI